MADDFDLGILSNPDQYRQSSTEQRRLYNYSVIVKFSKPVNGKDYQHMVVASNDILTAEQIQDTAQVYAVGGRYGVNADDITEIVITGASRSAALG